MTDDGQRPQDNADPAMRMLLKMGYRPGSGLGKREEGRTEPVEMTMRSKNVGIGYEDVPAAVDKKGDDLEEEEEEFIFLKGKKRRSLRIVDEAATASYVDMTGDTTPFSTEHPVDPLQTALLSLVRESQRSARIARSDVSRLQVLQSELSLLLRQESELLQSIDNVKRIIAYIDDYLAMKGRARMALSFTAIHDHMSSLQSICPEGALAISTDLLVDRDPLLLSEELQSLKSIVSSDLYLKIVQISWLKPLISGFQSMEADGLAKLLSEWHTPLPALIQRHIVFAHLRPKIQNQQTVHYQHFKPIIGLFDENDECLVSIRRSVGRDVQRLLDAGDKEKALRLFIEWREALPKKQTTLLALKHISPHIVALLSQIEINPQEQDTDNLQAALPWLAELSPSVQNKIISDSGLLEQINEYFQQWLSMDIHSIDFIQVALFYESWRAALPPSISFRCVLGVLHRCLDRVPL